MNKGDDMKLNIRMVQPQQRDMTAGELELAMRIAVPVTSPVSGMRLPTADMAPILLGKVLAQMDSVVQDAERTAAVLEIAQGKFVAAVDALEEAHELLRRAAHALDSETLGEGARLALIREIDEAT